MREKIIFLLDKFELLCNWKVKPCYGVPIYNININLCLIFNTSPHSVFTYDLPTSSNIFSNSFSKILVIDNFDSGFV